MFKKKKKEAVGGAGTKGGGEEKILRMRSGKPQAKSERKVNGAAGSIRWNWQKR